MIARAGLVAAVEQAADGIVITDTTGEIQYVNPAFTAMTGYTSQEAVGQNPRILKSGRQSGSEYEQLWDTIRAGRVWKGELINRRIDGTLYNEEMQITPVENATGEVVSFIAIKRDVTENRAAAEAQRFLAALVDSSDDAILAHTTSGVILSWNRGAEALFGYSSEEMVGKSSAILASLDHREEVGRSLATIREGRTVAPFESVACRKDGSSVDVSICVSPIRDLTGEVVGCSAIFRDIGKRVRAERKLRESDERFRSVFEDAPFGMCVNWATTVSFSRSMNLSAGCSATPRRN